MTDAPTTEPTADVLGPDYTCRTIPLRPDRFGPAVATLVHRRAKRNTRGAVLLVHGFADYFFHTEVAEHFTGHGYDCYAIDLRGYGRSLREHQLPNFVTDLSLHFEELDEAARLIRQEDGHDRLVVVAHSTGGLVTALWADARKTDGPLDALVLNSPWLDLAEPWATRVFGTLFIRAIGGMFPLLMIRNGLGTVYGQSIHRDHYGEWDYDLKWKPLDAFPVRAGWLRAIRKGHRQVHRGLDVRVPVLLLHSSRSLLRAPAWSEAVMKADTVLDVEHMRRWGPKIGRDVTLVEVTDGLHDLFLSAKPVRDRAVAEIDDWLDQRLPVSS